ncbi:MAG TPA: hypothetical protein ENF16_03655, partial [Bacteroidetes bacterium]|nr:hypothetical protein [Bacteroidota bacterium]
MDSESNIKKNETPGVVNSHKSRWSDLIRLEDYWAIWFGFVIIFGSLLQWIPKIPKVGDWTTNPLTAFMIVKEGLVTGNILLDLILLMVGLGMLTSIGIAFMRVEKIGRYFLGFIGVFIISCFAYWISHQANIKYCGLSYAMWALLVGLL